MRRSKRLNRAAYGFLATFLIVRLSKSGAPDQGHTVFVFSLLHEKTGAYFTDLLPALWVWESRSWSHGMTSKRPECLLSSRAENINTRWHDYGESHGGKLAVDINGDFDFIFTDASGFDVLGPSLWLTYATRRETSIFARSTLCAIQSNRMKRPASSWKA